MLYRPLSSPARKHLAAALLGALRSAILFRRQRRRDLRSIDGFRADQLQDLGLSEPDIHRYFPSQDAFPGKHLL